MLQVLFLTLVEDEDIIQMYCQKGIVEWLQDIIQMYHQKGTVEWPQDIIHQPHEIFCGIFQTKGHE